jgi:hypothetical protein
VTLPAFTEGGYSVRAQVITGNGEVAIVVGTSSYPWGLFAAAAIILLAGGLVFWRRLRRRRKTLVPPAEPGDSPGDSETASWPKEVARI